MRAVRECSWAWLNASVGVAVIAAAAVFTQSPQLQTLDDPTLTVPAGFVVEQVAGPPLVTRPIVADFDEEGRLYVADSSGSNDKVEQQLAERPHRIVRLADTDGDGRFDVSTVFADRMMLPEGAMWFDGSLYVAAPPSIWKLTDADADGIAERREEWFQGRTLTGCANDLHGPYMGPDGWIYWTKGAFAEQTYERPGRAPLVSRAAHILRRRPGDPETEIVMSGGMDNPVDVAFTPGGERIFTATFLEHPQAGRRDALVHAVYGGLYGKPHGVIDRHTRTGDLMPVLAHLGPAVPAGLTRYASGVLGEEHRDAFFAAMFNLRKVSRFVLEPDGATFRARESDFLVSSRRDFHPTDVIEDADGSLLVIDTGPWYKLCCPTSQLAKPDVPGAIYRIRRQGASAPADPRGRRLPWNSMAPSALATLLDDQRPAVQTRAIGLLGNHGEEAVLALDRVLESASAPIARRNAVWALTRIGSRSARQALRSALDDGDQSVRHAAVHSAGLWRDREAMPALLTLLKSGAPAIQRAAAEALGRIRDVRAVPALLAAASADVDRVLEHSLIYALIEIDQTDPVAAGLTASSSRTARAAMIALDQMDSGGLDPGTVIALLDSPDRVLNDTAWWIAERHPEWGTRLTAYFERRLRGIADGPARDDLIRRLAAFGASAEIQSLVAAVAAQPEGPASRAALQAMSRIAAAHLKGLPAAWIPPLVNAVRHGTAETKRLAVEVVGSTPRSAGAPELADALLWLARDGRRARDLRLDALAAAHEEGGALDDALFELVHGALASRNPLPARTRAAAVLERSRLTRAQLIALTRALPGAGALELSRVLRVFQQGSDEELGHALVSALAAADLGAALRPELVESVLEKYPDPVRQAAAARLAATRSDAARQAQHLSRLLETLEPGDVRRGQEVFNGSKAACASCHTIGYVGGRLGPDLTRIGEVRSGRDLLEALVFPSASFARGYEPMLVTLASGARHTGALRSDGPDEIVLGTVEHDALRIPRREVADMQPAAISLMPPGYDELLTRQELADLLAFLTAARR